MSVSAGLAQALAKLGVQRSFGILGGAILPLFSALKVEGLRPVQFRHENGAVFAAIEYERAGGGPVVVFTTTGPGLTNALTGVAAARAEGSKLILISGATAPGRRRRHAFQSTSPSELAHRGLFTDGGWFDLAEFVDHPACLPAVMVRLQQGLKRVGPFVAHLCLPFGTQAAYLAQALRLPSVEEHVPMPSHESLQHCAQRLSNKRCVVWVGAGAQNQAAAVRAMIARIPQVRVMSSPRGMGVFAASDCRFLGVTGFGGHPRVFDELRRFRPECTLVLGSKLGEFTSFWDPRLVSDTMIHVDVDPSVFGAAYPQIDTLGVVTEVGAFARRIEVLLPPISRAIVVAAPAQPTLVPSGLAEAEEETIAPPASTFTEPDRPAPNARAQGPVRPGFLMDMIQHMVVEKTDIPISSEAGNAFVWATQRLSFDEPRRYRTSMGFGSMGHFAAGVVGTALATDGQAMAIVGDGAMLMTNEVPTALQLGARVIWVVLNDSRLGLVDDGMQGLGYEGGSLEIPETNFARYAESMGAHGFRVECESQLGPAIARALCTDGPAIIDVIVDRSVPAPFGDRNSSIADQSASNACGEPSGEQLP